MTPINTHEGSIPFSIYSLTGLRVVHTTRTTPFSAANMRILLFCTTLVLFLVYIKAQEPAEAAAAEYDDVAAGEEVLDVVEEPTTTVKSRRSRLPATRTRSRTNSAPATAPPEEASNSDGGHHQAADAEAEAPADPPTKAPAKASGKRVRTTTSTTPAAPSEPAPKKTRTTTSTTAKSPSATEVVSTYKRPKFPPRRLPIPTVKPATEAPVDEFVDAEAADAGADAPLDPLPADAPLEEEIGAEEPLK